MYSVSIICILLMNFAKDVCSQSQPQITRDILPSIKRVGETGRLICTVTRQQDNVVHWIHRERSLTSDSKVILEEQFNHVIDGYRKVDVYKDESGDTNIYTLVIRRLQYTDRGIYTCQVQIRGQDVYPSKDGEMIVLIPPSIILRETNVTFRAQEGEDFDLHCNASGHPVPQIKWVRPNGESLPEPHNTFSYVGHSMSLRNITRDGRGVYRCIADNHVVPTTSQDVTVYISFQPYAQAVQTTYGQAQNMLYDITLECRVSGYPPPALQWYQVQSGNRNNLKAINDDERHRVHVLISYGQTLSMDEFWFQLTIINVQGNDYGNYVCEGTNKLGVHRAEIRLYETSECQGAYCYLAIASEVKSSATQNSQYIATSIVSLLTLLLLTNFTT